MRGWRWLVAVGVFAWAAAGGLRAQEAEPEEQAVVDNAGLFKESTVQKADQLIAEIRSVHHVGLYVETVKEMKEADRKKFPIWKTAQRYTFFRNWAQELAKGNDVDGVCVLICLNPHVITVVASPHEREEYFRFADCDALRKTFAETERKADADKALLALIDRFNSLLQEKGEPFRAPRPSWLVLLILVSALLGLWAVLAVGLMQLRRREARNVSTRAPLIRLERRPALMGAMFGAAPGYWLYDTLLESAPAPAVAHEGLEDAVAEQVLGESPLSEPEDSGRETETGIESERS